MAMRGAPGVVVAVVVGALLGGCSGGSEPVTTPTVSPSASSTPTPAPSPTPDAPTPPEQPARLATPSADSAAAVAGYFITLYPYARATGDLAAWRTLTGEECTFCASVIDEVTTLTSQGIASRGGAITVESAAGTEVIAGESYSAKLVFSEAPTEKWQGSELVSTGSGGRYDALVALRWTGGAWQVRAVDLTPSS